MKYTRAIVRINHVARFFVYPSFHQLTKARNQMQLMHFHTMSPIVLQGYLTDDFGNECTLWPVNTPPVFQDINMHDVNTDTFIHALRPLSVE
jgi:hypothetical protein